jgi:hypothetical protein
MAHQPVQPEPQLLLFPHEQYKRRHAYEVASAIARKKRRSKLNDHRRLSLQHQSTTQSMTTVLEERSDATTTVQVHRHYPSDDNDGVMEESPLPSIVAVDRHHPLSSLKVSVRSTIRIDHLLLTCLSLLLCLCDAVVHLTKNKKRV